jgi:hypothetical protein
MDGEGSLGPPLTQLASADANRWHLSRRRKGWSRRAVAMREAMTMVLAAAHAPGEPYAPRRSPGSTGIRLIRFPVAAKMAFATAGMIGGVPISPTPLGGRSLRTR